MSFYHFYFLSSGSEAWVAVPLFSLHWPTIAYTFWVNAWATSVIFAVLAACASHQQNHAVALAGYSAVSALRLSIANFWSGQILERIHMKWRDVFTRSVSMNNQLQKELVSSDVNHVNAEVAASYTYSNRLVAAWISQSSVQRKTTLTWLVVLFNILLVSNCFGLVPLFSAITGQAGYTLGLSLAFWVAVVYVGIERLTVRFVKLFLPSGPKWPMVPFFTLLESLSYTFRSISLGVRLFANMMAGHQLLHLITALALAPAVALPFVFAAPVTIATAALLMALSAMEAIVCVLQSGVFVLLASFYLTEGLTKKDALARPLSFVTQLYMYYT